MVLKTLCESTQDLLIDGSCKSHDFATRLFIHTASALERIVDPNIARLETFRELRLWGRARRRIFDLYPVTPHCNFALAMFLELFEQGHPRYRRKWFYLGRHHHGQASGLQRMNDIDGRRILTAVMSHLEKIDFAEQLTRRICADP